LSDSQLKWVHPPQEKRYGKHCRQQQNNEAQEKTSALEMQRQKRYPLKYIHVGRRIKYRPEDIDAFIAARTETGVRLKA
jgi:hypothetical protein